MHHQHHSSFVSTVTKQILKTVFGIALIFSLQAQAEPDENPTRALTRSKQSGQELQTQLSKNIYKSVPYQAHYTVQVPYSDQETYWDTETYYTNDYICHDYTDYERECRNVEVCTNSLVNLASVNQPMFIVPGPSLPPGQDPNRPAPYEPPPPPQRVCHVEQECQSVPVTRQQCGYEQTAHTQQVQKSRTVTRYRDEDRCCETLYQDVYDHQQVLAVRILFPAETELLEGENETLNLELTGSEDSPDVNLSFASSIFGYKVASQSLSGGVLNISLAQVPRYKAAAVSEKSILHLTAVPTATGLNFQFQDAALFPRISSQFQLILADTQTHSVISKTELTAMAQANNSGSLVVDWDPKATYEVLLKIHREGVVIEGGAVDFQIVLGVQPYVDESTLGDSNKLTFVVNGNGSAFKIKMSDATIASSVVDSKYDVKITRKNFWGTIKIVGEKVYSRASLKAAADGSFVLPVTDFGISKSDMDYLSEGSKIKLQVDVARGLPDGRKFTFQKILDFKL